MECKHAAIKFNKPCREWNCTFCLKKIDSLAWSAEVKKRKLANENKKYVKKNMD